MVYECPDLRRELLAMIAEMTEQDIELQAIEAQFDSMTPEEIEQAERRENDGKTIAEDLAVIEAEMKAHPERFPERTNEQRRADYAAMDTEELLERRRFASRMVARSALGGGHPIRHMLLEQHVTKLRLIDEVLRSR